MDKDVIRVENTRKKLTLFVNDKIQDVYLGAIALSNIRLNGKTTNNKEIKIVCGGDFKIHCYIFVDNQLVLESKK